MKKIFRAQYLELRHKTYYATYYIPKKIQHIVGKTKFTKSTKTMEMDLAIARASAIVLAWKEQINNLLYQSQDDFIASALDLNQQLRSSKDYLISETIREVAEEENRKYLNANSEYYSDNDFLKIATGEVKAIETLVPGWLTYEQKKGLKQKTIDQKSRDIKFLLGLFKVSSTINKKSVREWLEFCINEFNWTPSTIKRIVLTCRSFYEYLRTMKEIDFDSDNPFSIPSEHKRTKKHSRNGSSKNQIKSWVPFKTKEVEFLHRIAIEKEDIDLANLIVIGAYTGARIEELCSLRVENIDLEEGSFHIVDAKTVAGIREVPIHSRLKPLIKKLMDITQDGYLVSGLTFNKYMDRSNAIGKRFGRMKKREGFSELHTFHSIRKTTITMLENAGHSENLAADIVGHDKPNITFGLYSGGHTLNKKKEAIETLAFNFQINIKTSDPY